MRLKDKFIQGVWDVGIVESSIDELFNKPESIRIKWMKHHFRDRFFADPFLEGQDQKYYYFLAEEYVFWEARGKVSRLTVDKRTMKLVKKETILNEEHHISYPFLFDGYIIPEGYHSKATYAYRKLHGEEKYQRVKISEDALVDPTFMSYNGKIWLFATTKIKNEDAVKKLNIYYADQFGAFIPHKENPVKTNIKTARPAGKFFEYRGRLFRPVMDCEKLYGHMVRIMEIENLSEEEYAETEVMAFSSQKSPPYDLGFHTFNVYENCIVVDGYREYYSFLLKPCFIKLQGMFLFINQIIGNKGKEIIK